MQDESEHVASHIDEKKCDVFAFGVLIFLSVFKCYPYNNNDRNRY